MTANNRPLASSKLSIRSRWIALGALVFGFGWLAATEVAHYLGWPVTYDLESVWQYTGIFMPVCGAVTGVAGRKFLIGFRGDLPATGDHAILAFMAFLIVIGVVRIVSLFSDLMINGPHLIFAFAMSGVGAVCGLMLWMLNENAGREN